MRKCRKMISLIMLMVMLATLTPYQALAAEAPTGSTSETAAVVEPTQETDTEEAVNEVEAVEEETADTEQNTEEEETATAEEASDGTSVSGAKEDDEAESADTEEKSDDVATSTSTNEAASEEEPTDEPAEPADNASTGETSIDVAPVVEPVEKDEKAADDMDETADRGDLLEYVRAAGKDVQMDLTLNGVTIEPVDGVYTVDPANNPYRFVIRTPHMAYKPGIYTYQLPSQFTYVVSEENDANKIKDGTITIATFEISESGLLTAYFNKNANDSQDVTASFGFDLWFAGEHKEKVPLDEIEFEIDKNITGIPEIVKSGSKYDSAGKRFVWTIKVTCDELATAVGLRAIDNIGYSASSMKSKFLTADQDAGVIVTASIGGEEKATWTLKSGSTGFAWRSNNDKGTYGWHYDIPDKAPSDATTGAGTVFGKDWDFTFTCYSTRVTDPTGSGSTYYNRGWIYEGEEKIGYALGKVWVSGPGPGYIIDKSGKWTGENGQRQYMEWKLTGMLKNLVATDVFSFADRMFLYTRDENHYDTKLSIPDSITPDWKNISGKLTFEDSTGKTVTETVYPEEEGKVSASGYYLKLTKDTYDDDRLIVVTICNTNQENGSGLVGKATLVLTYTQTFTTEMRQLMRSNDKEGIHNGMWLRKNGSNVNGVNYSLIYTEPSKEIVTTPSKKNGYIVGFHINYIPNIYNISDYAPIIIEDKFSDTISFNRGSLKIVQKSTDADTELTEGTDFTWKYENHLLEIYINNPGLYYYNIYYTATCSNDPNDQNSAGRIPFSNEFSAIVNGTKTTYTPAEGELVEWDGSGHRYTINVNKVDESGKGLAGAKIGIYLEGEKLFKEKVTDSEGKAVFATSVSDDIIYKQNTPYYIEETEAPQGYKRDETQYWFVIIDKNFDGYQEDPTYWDKYFAGKKYKKIEAVSTGTTENNESSSAEATFEIVNTLNNTSVSGEKTWANDNPDLRPASITVKLYANDKEVQGKSVTVTPDKDGKWKYEFTDLPVNDAGGTITYSVKEYPVPSGYTVKYTGNDILNTYNATGKTTLDGNKTIENRNFKEGDTWTFEVTAVTEGAPMPANTSVTINPTSGTSKDFTFGEISFKLADMAGAKEKTFEYKIVESGSIAGVKNDSKVHNVSIKVTDDGKGNLTAVKTYKDGTATNNQKAKFVNTYGADGTYQLTGTKTITGRNFQAGDKWTFTVTAAEGTPMPAKTEVVIEPASGTSADIDFGTITYGLADAGKTYTYTVTETGTVAGVTNDPKNVKTVKVKVEDNGQGKLTATATKDSEAVEYENTYNAAGKTTLDGNKTIENRNFKEGDTWTFSVTAVTKDAPMPAKTSVTINPASGTSADFTFGEISFKLADMAGAKEKTFEYKIVESGSIAGVKNDSKVHNVSIKVTDDGKGNLTAVKTYKDGTATNNQKAKFVNTYGADGTYQLTGTKTITGRNFQAGDKWTFTVTAAEGTPMPEKTEVVIEPTSGTSADIDFGTITYGLANAGKTYTYTVTETGTVAGVTNDTKNVKTVKVMVEDNGQGKLTATATKDSEAVEYENTYNATGKTTLNGNKTIENRNFKEGDKWTFTVTAVTKDAPMPAKTSVTINPTSGASTDFTFGDISFKLADMAGAKEKTFEYKIEETGSIAGVSNDGGSHTVSVKVTDDGKGHLDAVKTYTDGETKNSDKSLRKESKMVQTKKQHCAFR